MVRELIEEQTDYIDGTVFGWKTTLEVITKVYKISGRKFLWFKLKDKIKIEQFYPRIKPFFDADYSTRELIKITAKLAKFKFKNKYKTYQVWDKAN